MGETSSDSASNPLAVDSQCQDSEEEDMRMSLLLDGVVLLASTNMMFDDDKTFQE